MSGDMAYMVEPNPKPAMSGDMAYIVVFLLGVEQT